MLKKSASSVLAVLRGSTYWSVRLRLFARCCLACGTARLGAPGLGGWEVWPSWASRVRFSRLAN